MDMDKYSETPTECNNKTFFMSSFTDYVCHFIAVYTQICRIPIWSRIYKPNLITFV